MRTHFSNGTRNFVLRQFSMSVRRVSAMHEIRCLMPAFSVSYSAFMGIRKCLYCFQGGNCCLSVYVEVIFVFYLHSTTSISVFGFIECRKIYFG